MTLRDILGALDSDEVQSRNDQTIGHLKRAIRLGYQNQTDLAQRMKSLEEENDQLKLLLSSMLRVLANKEFLTRAEVESTMESMRTMNTGGFFGPILFDGSPFGSLGQPIDDIELSDALEDVDLPLDEIPEV
jgi:hypothetical protein